MNQNKKGQSPMRLALTSTIGSVSRYCLRFPTSILVADRVNFRILQREVPQFVMIHHNVLI
jgi:hypothetical protein